MKTIKVKNMTSSNGNKISNQFIINDYKNQKEIFQSYKSIIAIKDLKKDKIYLDSYYWNYSVTTGKYRNIFLNEKKNETQKKINSKEYILKDLN